jgi:hypothetical protein
VRNFGWTAAVSFLPLWLLLAGALSGWWSAPFAAKIIAAAPGLLYYPMALLAVSLLDSALAVGPRMVIPSIRRVWKPYLVTCAALVVGLGGHMFLEWTEDTVPVLGELADAAVSLYVFVFLVHILGLLYRTNRFALNWFGER